MLIKLHNGEPCYLQPFSDHSVIVVDTVGPDTIAGFERLKKQFNEFALNRGRTVILFTAHAATEENFKAASELGTLATWDLVHAPSFEFVAFNVRELLAVQNAEHELSSHIWFNSKTSTENWLKYESKWRVVKPSVAYDSAENYLRNNLLVVNGSVYLVGEPSEQSRLYNALIAGLDSFASHWNMEVRYGS